jgi:hypothetical protein
MDRYRRKLPEVIETVPRATSTAVWSPGQVKDKLHGSGNANQWQNRQEATEKEHRADPCQQSQQDGRAGQ